MGYNGSNRKGYDRGYSGFSKSSMRSGNSMLFGKRGIVTGLFDIGSSVTKGIATNTPTHTYTTSNYGTETLQDNDSTTVKSNKKYKSDDIEPIVGCFIASLVLFFVAYITEWYNFFYIIGYISLFGSLVTTWSSFCETKSKYQKYLVGSIIAIIGICAMVAPFFLFDVWNITFIVITLPIIIPLYFYLVSICNR